ncbi:unnamed protein product [Urochloa decumbens]|uniref:Uncharacterized protein n=1 Tax=Urochloa decumbens TaxID=240449 RepID=A0ABC9C0U8_9POAL
MTVAASDAAPASRRPPPGSMPALGRRGIAAVRALMFTGLASLWVGSASAAAAAVIRTVHPSGEGAGRLIDALVTASFAAILFAMLLAQVVFMLLLNTAFSTSDSVLKACGSKLRAMLRVTGCFGYAEALLFVLPSLVGTLVVAKIPKGSRAGRVVTPMIDVGVVGCAAIACFDILPSMVLKLWRVKLRVAAAAAARHMV